MNKNIPQFFVVSYLFSNIFATLLKGRSLIRVVLDHRWHVLPGIVSENPLKTWAFLKVQTDPSIEGLFRHSFLPGQAQIGDLSDCNWADFSFQCEIKTPLAVLEWEAPLVFIDVCWKKFDPMSPI